MVFSALDKIRVLKVELVKLKDRRKHLTNCVLCICQLRDIADISPKHLTFEKLTDEKTILIDMISRSGIDDSVIMSEIISNDRVDIKLITNLMSHIMRTKENFKILNIRLVPYILDSKESNITSPWASTDVTSLKWEKGTSPFSRESPAWWGRLPPTPLAQRLNTPPTLKSQISH